MSTAKETVERTAEGPQSPPELTPADFADILSTTLAMAAEAGLFIGIRCADATPTRPAGLVVFVAGLTNTADGRLAAHPNLE